METFKRMIKELRGNEEYKKEVQNAEFRLNRIFNKEIKK